VQTQKYAYIVRKRKGRVHEIDDSGRTYCQAENTTKRLSYTDKFPEGRRACLCCAGIKRELEYRATHGILDAEFSAILNDCL
jgi:hypothetical protein